MGNIDTNMCNVKEIDEPIKVGTGDSARAIKKGDLPLAMRQADGTMRNIVLGDYKYSPDLGYCLFSIMKALSNGWQIRNQGRLITLSKGDLELTFNKFIRTTDGLLSGIELMPRTGEFSNLLMTPEVRDDPTVSRLDSDHARKKQPELRTTRNSRRH